MGKSVNARKSPSSSSSSPSSQRSDAPPSNESLLLSFLATFSILLFLCLLAVVVSNTTEVELPAVVNDMFVSVGLTVGGGSERCDVLGIDGPVTLRYFNLRGRAEAIRLLLEDGGVAYTDVRVGAEGVGSWSDLKQEWEPILAFGQLPQLSVGNRSIVQSHAILRYLGRALGMAGEGAEEELLCDVIAGGAEDLRKLYSRLVYASSQEEFETNRVPFVSEVLPAKFAKFEALLHHNSPFYGKINFFVSEQLTYADVLVFDVVDAASRLSPTSLDEFPILRGFMDRVRSRKNIKAYLKSDRRPTASNGMSAAFEN
eukprot:TRINITY_DN3575_c0_g1_i1.p1 TRINITY_DN3575_c0_g1~~TRINITY_DN3575_c0_g1_i1.p1  ORF type:complete len:328 (-),score=90.26 TRINITY_DN3575_c0_g1_i1:155-1096(-)